LTVSTSADYGINVFDSFCQNSKKGMVLSEQTLSAGGDMPSAESGIFLKWLNSNCITFW
jgi:hypothetical protein